MIFNFGLLFSASGPAMEQLTHLSGKINEIGEHLKKVGGFMKKNFTDPFVKAAEKSVEVSGEFEKIVLKLNRKLGETPEVIKKLEDASLSLSKKGIIPINSIQLLQKMAFFGMNANEILSHMVELVDYATVSGTDLSEVTEQLYVVMDQFGLTTEDTNSILTTLTYTAGKTGQTTSSLIDSFRLLKGEGSDLGWSLTTIASAYNILADKGFKSTIAGKQLLQVIQKLKSLYSPSSDTKILSNLGIRQKDLFDSKGQLLDLGHVLDVLKGKLNPSQFNDIFGKYAVAAKLLVNAGSKGLEENSAKGQEKRNERGAEAVEKGYVFGTAQLNAAIAKLRIVIGNSGLLEFFTKGVNKITAFIEKLTQTNPGLIRIGLIFGAIVAVAGTLIGLIGSAVITFFAIGAIIASVGLPMIGIIAGIVAAVIGLTAIFTSFATNTKNKIAKAFMFLLGPIGWVIGWIMTRWNRILPFFKLLFWAIGEALKPLIQIAKKVTEFISPILDAIFWMYDKTLGLMEKLAKFVLPKDLQEKFGFTTTAKTIYEINNPKQKQEINQTTTINLTGVPAGMGAYSLDPNTLLRGAQ
jgi:TP901 family phage tail tape measure protein